MTEDEYRGDSVDVEKFFTHSFGLFRVDQAENVELHFSPKISPFVRERKWHSSQKVVSKTDGSIQVSLHVGITPELVNWILGFGAEVYVCAPELLRERVKEEAKKIIEQSDEPKKLKRGA
jgi:predicted DNA-binding transcriptional regulator YafY